jgi:hypothetical protein
VIKNIVVIKVYGYTIKKYHTDNGKLFVSIESVNSKSKVSTGSANSKPNININLALIDNNKIYKCKYCNNIYKHKQSKFKHEQKCKNKTDLSIVIEENNLLKQELSEIKNQLAIFVNKQAKVHPKTLQKINNQLVNTNNINNTTNNMTNNIINNNNTTNNITIKFGSENLANILSDKEMQTILSKCRKSIEESIKKVHFNDNRPEFKNVLITNLQNNIGYIFNGKKFEAQTKDSILNELLNKHFENIKEYIEEDNIENKDNKDILSKYINNRNFQKFLKEMNGIEKHTDLKNYKEYKLNEIKLLLYNNSEKNIMTV